MNTKNPLHRRFTLALAVFAGTLWFGGPATAEPDLADTTEKLVRSARHGAQVRISPEARQRVYGLLLQGAPEGVPIYGFNRGAGQQREVARFSGDPLAPETRAMLEEGQRRFSDNSPSQGQGPGVSKEEIMRDRDLRR